MKNQEAIKELLDLFPSDLSGKALWLNLVMKVLKENPGWMAKTVQAIQSRVEKRIKKELTYSNDIEIGMVSLLSTPKAQKKELILKGLEAMGRFKGTPWHDEMIKKYSK